MPQNLFIDPLLPRLSNLLSPVLLVGSIAILLEIDLQGLFKDLQFLQQDVADVGVQQSYESLFLTRVYVLEIVVPDVQVTDSRGQQFWSRG